MPLSGGGSFASAFSSGCYSSLYGAFNPYYAYSSRYSMFGSGYGFGYGYGNNFGGCGDQPRYFYGFSNVPGPVAVTPTPVTGSAMRPIAPPGRPTLPTPGTTHPRVPLQRTDGDTRTTQPVRPIISADAATSPRDGRVGPRTYRDRGLLTPDDGAAERPRAATLSPRGVDQPSITDMVGRRRFERCRATLRSPAQCTRVRRPPQRRFPDHPHDAQPGCRDDDVTRNSACGARGATHVHAIIRTDARSAVGDASVRSAVACRLAASVRIARAARRADTHGNARGRTADAAQ
jgi:hypothetical protein